MAAEGVKSSWLIKGNGDLNTKVDRDLKLVPEDGPVAIVSIVGGQSTGKSTLLNHLFGAGFVEMNAEDGRNQTTKGIWVAKKRMQQCCLLVLDTEGSDGAEQEDDVKFEKQTTLFGVAVSHTMIINMWCHEVGRNQAAGWPRLKIVFEVMMRLCEPRKINLIFVLRDKTKSPLESLERQIKDKACQMWQTLPKPRERPNAQLHEYFKIEVVAMSHYEHKRFAFDSEVADLKNKIISYSTSVRSRYSHEIIPASGFVDYAKGIWGGIQAEKYLDLPRERIMVSESLCNKIAKEIRREFCDDKVWRRLQMAVNSKEAVKDFGGRVNSLIYDYLSQYDKETLYYDKTTRYEIGDQLRNGILQVVQPVHLHLLERESHVALEIFKESINLEEDYIKNGKDFRGVNVVQDHMPAFLTELDNLFADAHIECTNWNHSTKLRETKKREAKAFLEHENDIFLGKVKIMFAQLQCNQIAEIKKTEFCDNKSWIQVKNDIVCSKVIVECFGDKVKSLIDNCISEYDEEAQNFDVTVVEDRRIQLLDELLEVVEPIHLSLVEHVSQVALENFQKSIDLEKDYVENGEALPDVLNERVRKMLRETHLYFKDASIVYATWDHPAKLAKLLQFNIDEAHTHARTELNKLIVKIERGDSKLLWKLAGSGVKAAGHKLKNRVSTFLSQFNGFIVMWLQQKLNASASSLHSGLIKIYRMCFEKYSTKRIN